MMKFENLIKSVESVATHFNRLQGPPKLAIYFCFAFALICFWVLFKEVPTPKKDKVNTAWEQSEWLDLYDAFNHVPHCVWCDFKRIKLKEKQLGGYDGRIIKARGIYFEYAFRLDGCRLIVCSNLKKDRVYRY